MSRPAFPSPKHDHHRCRKDALASAERLCVKKGVRLTDLRRRVLELVWRNHEPVGAYALLDALKADGHSGAPPTVYRALEFLMEQGLIHRIESRNAYVGCAHPGENHAVQFLLCSRCGAAAELEGEDLQALLAARAAKLGFKLARARVEAEGLCPACGSQGK